MIIRNNKIVKCDYCNKKAVLNIITEEGEKNYCKLHKLTNYIKKLTLEI